MANALTVFFIILHIVWWPTSKLITAVIFLLSPFCIAGSFLLLPFMHLGHTIIHVISFPFNLQWRERFETLYIYIGIACLVGCTTGTILFIIFKFLASILKIDSTIVPRAGERGRTAAEYRATRRERRGERINHSSTATPVVLKKVAGPRRRGLLSQAIIEEEESDF